MKQPEVFFHGHIYISKVVLWQTLDPSLLHPVQELLEVVILGWDEVTSDVSLSVSPK